MEVTITLPDNFSHLPETEKLKILSEKIDDLQETASGPNSKWEGFARELQEKKLLSGAGDFVLNQSGKFREDFSFKHDIE